MKEKITTLLSDLDSFKSNQEVIIERYEKKITEKIREIERWEKDYEEMAEVVGEIRNMAVTAYNVVGKQQILDILNKKR